MIKEKSRRDFVTKKYIVPNTIQMVIFSSCKPFAIRKNLLKYENAEN